MSPRKIAELSRAELRREILKSTLVILSFSAASIAIFFTIPFNGIAQNSHAVVRLLVGLVVLGLIVALFIRRIMTAQVPQLKALEALVIVLVKFICLFSGTYLAMSHIESASFSVALTHTSALYFTIVTFGTVGYGDIVAQSDVARLLVSAQIVIDFIFIAALVRAFVAVAQISLKKGETSE